MLHSAGLAPQQAINSYLVVTNECRAKLSSLINCPWALVLIWYLSNNLFICLFCGCNDKLQPCCVHLSVRGCKCIMGYHNSNCSWCNLVTSLGQINNLFYLYNPPCWIVHPLIHAVISLLVDCFVYLYQGHLLISPLLIHGFLVLFFKSHTFFQKFPFCCPFSLLIVSFFFRSSHWFWPFASVHRTECAMFSVHSPRWLYLFQMAPCPL